MTTIVSPLTDQRKKIFSMDCEMASSHIHISLLLIVFKLYCNFWKWICQWIICFISQFKANRRITKKCALTFVSLERVKYVHTTPKWWILGLLIQSWNLGSLYDKSQGLVFWSFILLRVLNHLSFSLGFLNKDLSVSASLAFYHLSPLVRNFSGHEAGWIKHAKTDIG